MIVTMQDYTITDRAPVLIGYEGENLSRNFTVKTADDLSAIASIELLIDDVNCGAMTVNNTDDTEITISLDAFMIGRAGYKKAQLIMLDDTGAIVMKSNQIDVLVGASNNPRYYASGEKVKTLTVNIDGRTRQIILPAGFAVSVNGDVAVDHIAFKAPASYGDFDFSAAACRVDWTGVDGTSHKNICTEKDADGNWIWALPTALTRGGEGEISFSVSYVVTDSGGAVTADWNTGLVKFYHLESAKSDDAEEDVEEETTYDRLASAIAAVRAAQASVDDVNTILAGITSATPTVVETVADLNSLDTSKVKLAIVAADGYLYYYDGTAWKSGFAYGGLQEVIAARTDSDGVTHADLKTRLNTAEAQIKEDLSATRADFTVTWERKGISSGNGSLSTSTTRLASGYVPKNATHIYCDSGYKYVLAAYDGTTYVGEWNGTEFVKSASWLTGEVDVSAFIDYNLRICLAYSSDAEITLDGASGLHLYALTDTTLKQQGKAADAKETGRRLDEVEKFAKDAQGLLRIEKNALDVSFNDVTKTTSNTEYRIDDGTLTIATAGTYSWKLAYIENIDNWLVNGKTYRLRCGGKVVSGNGVLRVSLVRASSSLITENSLFIADGDIGEMTFIKNAEMVSLGFSVTGSSASKAEVMYYGFEIAEVVEYSAIDNYMRVLNADSWRVANIIANANNVMNIKWTPVGNMPKNNGGYFAIAEQKGLPYSSARDQDKAIGMDVSIYTFMSALRDPNSVLYKRKSTVANSSAYYGTVCSGLINYSTGIGLDLTNYFLGESDLFDTIPMQSIIPGDMIWISGHCALIYATKKDKYGRIAEVIVAEEWQPLPRYVVYNSWDAFISGRNGYIARRYKKECSVPYTAIPWVQNFDEVEETVTYPDIQTDHGDKAVFMVGEDVLVNVIDAKDYTQIVVDRAGTTVQTLTAIEAFTLSNVQPGLYTITASGGANTSVSTFFVVDATGSFDTSTGIVTFSSTNATPVMVNVYNLPANRNITAKPIILTDADREAGRLDVSSYMDADYQYAKVTFMTDYGTAVWYSETHEKWTPIT